MAFLLDTNIVSDLMRNPQGVAATHVNRTDDADICTSIVVAAELRYAVLRARSRRLAERLEAVLAPLTIMPLDAPVDRIYGEIRFDLEKKAKQIGPNDLLIAAHALALGCTLVTDNVQEFQRIKSLSVVNWLR